VVDAYPPLQQGKHQRYRRQLLVVLRQRTYRIAVYLLYTLLLTLLVEVATLKSSSILFTVSFGEAEDDAGVKFLIDNESNNLFDLLALCSLLLLLLALLLENLVKTEVVL
jgi:hypothetical protein